MKSSRYLGLVIGLIISQGAVASETFNAKLNGAGHSTARSDFMSATVNTAPVTRYDASEDFGLNINAGVLGLDKDDLIDTADDIRDQIENLDRRNVRL